MLYRRFRNLFVPEGRIGFALRRPRVGPGHTDDVAQIRLRGKDGPLIVRPLRAVEVGDQGLLESAHCPRIGRFSNVRSPTPASNRSQYTTASPSSVPETDSVPPLPGTVVPGRWTSIPRALMPMI